MTDLLRETIVHTEAIFKENLRRPPVAGPHIASYPDMRADATISACLLAMNSEILARDWYLTPHPETKDLEAQLTSAEIEIALAAQLDQALWRGFSPAEITWKNQKRRYTIASLADINADQIGFNVDDEARIISYNSIPIGGQEKKVPAGKVWLQRHKGSRLNIAGLSILEPAYRSWFAKDQTLRLYSLAIQKFGMRQFLIATPSGSSDATYDSVRTAIFNLRIDGVANIPDSVVVTPIEPSYAATVNFVEALAGYNAQLELALKGTGSEPTNQGAMRPVGTALSEYAKTTRYIITTYARELTNQFTAQVIKPLFEANNGLGCDYPSLHLRGMTDTDPDAETLRQQGTAQNPETTQVARNSRNNHADPPQK